MKTTRAIIILFLLFIATFVAGNLFEVQAATSQNLKIINESNKKTLLDGSINLGSYLGVPPLRKVTTATQPRCIARSLSTDEVGGTGVIDNTLGIFAIYINGRDVACDEVIEESGIGGEKLYTYYSSDGAIDVVGQYTAMMIKSPPISSTEYIADLRNDIQQSLGIQPAYAQGLGFSSLSPVLELWKLFRNLAYFFFVIIFLVTGFLIMFRSKIGGSAAVTVQQALPQIVVSLLLVTFSYAIAGLMLDLMYIIIYLIIGIFARPSIPGLTSPELTSLAFERSIFQNVFALFGSPTAGEGGVVGSIAGAIGNVTVETLGLSTGLVADFVQGTSNVVFTLILGIAVLFAMFKVFFALIQAYAGIFFSVIFAPMQLLFGALPGRSSTFAAWIKGLLENLIVFPTLILLLILAHFFTKQTFVEADRLGFSPPQLTSNQGTTGFAVFSALIPLAIVLSLADIIKISKGLLKGQLDINPTELGKRFRQSTQLALPAMGATTGGVLGGVWGAAQGIKARQRGIGDIANNFWRGYKDPNKGYVGGVKGSFGSGWQRGAGAARIVDNAIEGRIGDPSDTANLLRNLNRNNELEKRNKDRAEAAAKANQNRRPV